MLYSDITYARLRALLRNLGFLEQVINGTHYGFYHAASDTIFTFRLYNPQDPVTMMDLRGVRFQLDWRGLLNPEAFDAALRKVPA